MGGAALTLLLASAFFATDPPWAPGGIPHPPFLAVREQRVEVKNPPPETTGGKRRGQKHKNNKKKRRKR
jgi:hypothetical protein